MSDRKRKRLMAHVGRRLASLVWIGLGPLLGTSQPAHALVFNVTFDASADSAPAGFKTAFQDAVQFLATTYNDPITVNINAGWGEVDGLNLTPGLLGQSLAKETTTFTYSQVRTALINDAKSSDDATAIAGLPTADPTGGTSFIMSFAEAKALGLVPGATVGADGFVGFNSTTNWTFEPNNRAVPGKFDFIAVAEHEITEVLGRYGIVQNACAFGCAGPIDLFRYTAPGVRDFTPTNGSYFSIDGGNTKIKTFNGTAGGDLSDWAALTPDAFNTPIGSGELMPFSAADTTLMDVIGYDLVPEPGTLTLLGLGFAALALIRPRGA